MNLLIDFNRLSNMRSISYTLFTPFISLKYAFIFISNSFFIYATYLKFSSLSTISWLWNYEKDSTDTMSIIFELSVDGIEKSIQIWSKFYIWKESISMSIPIYSLASIPYSDTLKTNNLKI